MFPTDSSAPLSYAVHTMGCRLNQAESAAMAGGLESLGLVPAESAPSVWILHTCAITREAETEAERLVRRARREHPEALIAVTGCAVALPDAAQALRNAGADLLVSQSDKPDLPSIVATRLPAPLPAPPGAVAASVPRHPTTRAPVKVQDGCGFHCTYCIVPDTRGAPRSRDFDDILSECRGLLAAGYRELVVTGVNVACYRHKGRSLTDLVRAMIALPDLARVRLGSVEPATTERELLAIAAEEPRKICRFFHFPLQSGDTPVLRAMGRHYTAEAYEELAEHTLDLMPDACLGADVITGFPGESDASFERTRSLLERIPFGNLHVFPYSERPGTPAASMPGSVPVRVRRDRAKELIALADKKHETFARRFLGKTVEVLIEKVSPDGLGTGWTGEYVKAEISGCTRKDVNTLRPLLVRSVRGATLS